MTLAEDHTATNGRVALYYYVKVNSTVQNYKSLTAGGHSPCSFTTFSVKDFRNVYAIMRFRNQRSPHPSTTLGPFLVFILLNGWICLHGVLDKACF